MINGASSQALPISRGISSSSTTPARATVPPQLQKARHGAAGIPPRQAQQASDRITYAQAVKTHYNVKFKSGFAINGQAGRPIEKQFSGNLAGLADVILQRSGPRQMACKLLVGLANQQKDPTLAKNAQVVLEAVWGQAEKAGASDIIGGLHQAYQLNFTPNHPSLKALEPAVVQSPSLPSPKASPAKPAAATPAQVVASTRQNLVKQKTTYDQKRQEHYKMAEWCAKHEKRARMAQGLSVVGGLAVAAVSLFFPVALFGLMPVAAAFKAGSNYERDCRQLYVDSMERAEKLEEKIKAIDAKLARA